MTQITKGGDKYELSTDINVITAEINAYQRVAGEAIFEIGRRLKHVKENDLVHGEYMVWYESNGMNKDFVSKAIRITEQLPNFETSRNLGMEALYQIATMPEDSREQPHTIPSTGVTKTPDEMTVRELREVKAALKKAEEHAKQAEAQAKVSQRSEDNMRQRLEDAENAQFEDYPEPEQANDAPYGVKLSLEIRKAIDEASEWQKENAWLITDRDEFKLLIEASPDIAREFQRLDKFWSQLSNAFHSVDNKGTYNTEKPKTGEAIDAVFTEIL